jgi:hypothetical protein
LKKEIENLKIETSKIEIHKNKVIELEKNFTLNKQETKVRIDICEGEIYRHKQALDEVQVMKGDFFRALEVRHKLWETNSKFQNEMEGRHNLLVSKQEKETEERLKL